MREMKEGGIWKKKYREIEREREREREREEEEEKGESEKEFVHEHIACVQQRPPR